MTVGLRPPTRPLCWSRYTSIEFAMSGPNAAYGPEKPDSRPIFSASPLPPAVTAGAAVAAGGALVVVGGAPLHAIRMDVTVAAPVPVKARRSSIRRDIPP